MTATVNLHGEGTLAILHRGRQQKPVVPPPPDSRVVLPELGFLAMGQDQPSRR